MILFDILPCDLLSSAATVAFFKSVVLNSAEYYPLYRCKDILVFCSEGNSVKAERIICYPPVKEKDYKKNTRKPKSYFSICYLVGPLQRIHLKYIVKQCNCT